MAKELSGRGGDAKQMRSEGSTAERSADDETVQRAVSRDGTPRQLVSLAVFDRSLPIFAVVLQRESGR